MLAESEFGAAADGPSNPVFRQPADEAAAVWRYMDFAKFVDLLATEELYFARADKLGDPFEGLYPRAVVEERRRALLRLAEQRLRPSAGNVAPRGATFV